MTSWTDHGIEPDEAFTLTILGLAPALAARWLTYNLDVEEIAEWLAVGIVDPVDASSWICNGLGPTEAHEFLGLGFTVEDAGGWAVTGLSPSASAERRDAGRSPRDEEPDE